MNVDDLLLELTRETRRGVGSEVDNDPTPSTRGTAEGSGPTGARQKSYIGVAFGRWPKQPRWQPTQRERDEHRAALEQAKWAAAALDGAPLQHAPFDSDEADLLLRAQAMKTLVWVDVEDGEGQRWLCCPGDPTDDLPQPVRVIGEVRKPLVPVRHVEADVLPIDKLAGRTLGRPPKMQQSEIDAALARMDAGERPVEIAMEGWQRWGFSSPKSAEASLRRQRRQRDEQKEVAAA